MQDDRAWEALRLLADRRFGRRVKLGSPRQCWEWTGPKDADGYGRYRSGGRSVPAHREAYRQLKSPYQPFGRLRHTCGNRGCVNPDHLEEIAPHLEWEERFWSKVDRLTRLECWQWKGAISAEGYGVFHFQGKTRYAHQVAVYFARRPGLPDYPVTHSCGNRACVNPRHLRDDSYEGRRKLSEDAVLEIREAAAKGESHASLARDYEVSRSMISRIVSRKRWARLEEEDEDLEEDWEDL